MAPEVRGQSRDGEWIDVYQVNGGYFTKVASFRYSDDALPYLREMAGSGYASHQGRIIERKGVEIDG